MELCSGGIFGMGESWEQRIEFAEELRALGPVEIPLNFLNPRPGTPLGDQPLLPPLDAIRIIALWRLFFPRATLRYAGGREVVLRDLQALGLLAGANGLIMGNYLTTTGRSPEDDLRMLADLRMPRAGGRDLTACAPATTGRGASRGPVCGGHALDGTLMERRNLRDFGRILCEADHGFVWLTTCFGGQLSLVSESVASASVLGRV